MKPRMTQEFDRRTLGVPSPVQAVMPAGSELEASRVVKKMKPGQAGALKLARQYGDALVCVRYRHDAQGQRRYTTVEVVIECVALPPRPTKERVVEIKLNPFDQALRSIVQASGGKWDSRARVWRLPIEIATRLGLLGSVVVR